MVSSSVNKNKKSRWLKVSVSKLLGEQSGNIKMQNGLFGQNFQSKIEKVDIAITYYIFKLA